MRPRRVTPPKTVRYNFESPNRVYELDESCGRLNILIVEDDENLAEFLKDALALSGLEATCVPDGVQGIKLLLAREYDLILCDMAMPGFPGDMFYRAVERVRPELCQRFLFMTGHRGDPGILDFVRSVRGLLIWKPFEMYQLLEAMSTILSKRGKKLPTLND